MELILNLLTLKTNQRKDFLRVAEGYEQIFAPNGVLEDGRPIPRSLYRRAAVILGNPTVQELAVCENLRLLQTRSAGTEQYQKPGVLPKGVTLLNASGAYGHSVSEHMLAMLLSLMKRLPAYRDRQRDRSWIDLGPVRTLAGAQVLCVGTGDLGSSFARLCKALGARTAGVRRNAVKSAEGIDEMYPMAQLDDLLTRADVVALTLPHSADTVHLMNRRRLLLMKKDAILLNGGRGSAVDCAALAQVLKDGHLWGAGLDVTDPEPLPADHPLWEQERTVLTPHTAGGDHLADTADRIAVIALEHLDSFLAEEQRRDRSQSTPRTDMKPRQNNSAQIGR